MSSPNTNSLLIRTIRFLCKMHEKRNNMIMNNQSALNHEKHQLMRPNNDNNTKLWISPQMLFFAGFAWYEFMAIRRGLEHHHQKSKTTSRYTNYIDGNYENYPSPPLQRYTYPNIQLEAVSKSLDPRYR